MQNRRKFLQNMAVASIAGMIPSAIKAKPYFGKGEVVSSELPVILSTWSHGLDANDVAMKTLEQGGSVLDAVEAGVRVPEADPENRSVGLGGLPDRDGHVTLDACIMDKEGNAGSVCYLEQIVHPISVARLVMEKTPHVMLAGDGALQFALDNGFKKENLLTSEAEKEWRKWLKKEKYEPKANWENNPNLYHDTIGLIAVDKNGDLAGACTTSGMPFKMHGRVGDSPIIGAGLFVDNEVGAATATGMGEFMMKTLGSFLVVELMRQGKSPQQACEEAVKRVVQKNANIEEVKGGMMQVGYIAINKKGEVGAYSLVPGFNYALCLQGENKMHDSPSYFL
jgi:isoaspartyl peptidase/L-asparaginase-like protein (Ntn-hydrolase superfamily)